ncbi:MAG: 2-amino-4-hydroxy-6-hydroxymethyldihydropteridine diphosphokinase, partial [Acidimicrobiia bacterium]|nr:2-amino-4-hydroxy-6-hydroxymethyldihydropteridine diphosphokinase [Acidimicrobiia bacterium]
AVTALGQLGTVVAVSAPIETEPVGGPPGQGRYLNAVAVLDTNLEPRRLLDECLTIELAQGRVRDERWGPRTLDLDILLFGDRQIAQPGLTIPHPELARRPFVLEPLAEVWPDARYPDGSLVQSRGRLTDPEMAAPSYIAVFLTTGLLAVALWWIMDLFLG